MAAYLGPMSPPGEHPTGATPPGARVDHPALAAERLGHGRPRLVLVHGFTQTGRSWAPIAADLACDHEVVLVDLPGHGGSGPVRATLPEAGALVGDAGGHGVYVGYSLGARVCLHLALARPDRTAGLVLLGGTGGIDDPVERADRRAADEALAADLLAGGLDPFLDRWLALPLFSTLPPDARDREDRQRNTVAGLAASLRLAGTGTQEPLWERLGALTAPVLVLAGALDRRFVQHGERLARCIGPNATFATVPGAGHAAHREQPEAFLRLLRAWLGTLP
jgi:2-succinyl-6-hydroxy-2,4-cyclohexadiene-1-carboxylate synthase